jgi:hypothetical protein
MKDMATNVFRGADSTSPNDGTVVSSAGFTPLFRW